MDFGFAPEQELLRKGGREFAESSRLLVHRAGRIFETLEAKAA